VSRPVAGDEFTLHWTVPSSIYAGSVVPRWQKFTQREDALEHARTLLERKDIESVTLRSVEVIR
jgi:hypothetical protein